MYGTKFDSYLSGWLKTKGMSHSKFADECGIDRKTLTNMRNGAHGIGFERAHSVSNVLGISLDELYQLTH